MHKLRGTTTASMWQRLRQSAAAFGDKITETTGWAAIGVPLPRASGQRQVTLDIPGYVQTNSYGCGAVSAAMVVRHFSPGTPFATIYAAVEPDPESGATTAQVREGLLACGIEGTIRRRLTFRALCDAVKSGAPVLVSIRNPGAANRHWAVVYGYGLRPDLVFIAGNGLPWLSQNPVSLRQFRTLWDPKGNGILCTKRQSSRPTRRGTTSTRWK